MSLATVTHPSPPAMPTESPPGHQALSSASQGPWKHLPQSCPCLSLCPMDTGPWSWRKPPPSGCGRGPLGHLLCQMRLHASPSSPSQDQTPKANVGLPQGAPACTPPGCQRHHQTPPPVGGSSRPWHCVRESPARSILRRHLLGSPASVTWGLARERCREEGPEGLSQAQT